MIDSINEAFGMKFQSENIDRIKGLPLFMTAKRSFIRVTDGANEFLLVKLPAEEQFGAIALSKQKDQIEIKSGKQVAFFFETVTRSQRDSLISHRIPFISGDRQLYLPFLGMAIHNSIKKQKEIKVDKMMPLTQSLFLYLLYECSGIKIAKKNAADALGVAKTSITRACDQLLSMGLISQEMSGKECLIHTTETGRELFIKAKNYLINPIQESFSVNENSIPKQSILAGESALSKYSMLNTPKIRTVAAYKSWLSDGQMEPLDEQWDEVPNKVRIELWKYNPSMFAKEGKVDPVSLYMTLCNTSDERIEGTLEEMMEEYKW